MRFVRVGHRFTPATTSETVVCVVSTQRTTKATLIPPLRDPVHAVRGSDIGPQGGRIVQFDVNLVRDPRFPNRFEIPPEPIDIRFVCRNHETDCATHY